MLTSLELDYKDASILTLYLVVIVELPLKLSYIEASLHTPSNVFERFLR